MVIRLGQSATGRLQILRFKIDCCVEFWGVAKLQRTTTKTGERSWKDNLRPGLDCDFQRCILTSAISEKWHVIFTV